MGLQVAVGAERVRLRFSYKRKGLSSIMNIFQLQQDLIDYAHSIGIDKIGFAAATPFEELKSRLRRHQQLGYASGFEEPDIDKRTEPWRLMDDVQSIVAIALAYPSKMDNAPVGKKGARRGVFCRASWGTDYHTVLRDKLKLLEQWLHVHVPNVRMQSMVDTGALSDRAVAERAGIGWSAKNTAIITPEFGSYVYLGEMLTNIPFEPSIPLENECGDCTLCIDVCPTGAIVEAGVLNSQRCIAFLTQTKSVLPDEFRSKIGNRLYGCDTCQTVCPKNKGKVNWLHNEFKPDPELAKPLLLSILTMSNREFKEKFGHVSGSWRGKKPIQRNAILALAHFKEQQAIPELINILQKDDRSDIRGIAAWALGKVGGEAAKKALILAQQQEQTIEVQQEVEKALQLLQ